LLAADSPSVCVMVRVDGGVQPLCAVYSRSALGVLERELNEGRWKVAEAIEAAGQVKMLDFEDAGWFANLNTPEEFAKAERRLGQDSELS
jgi:molybdenum cofactor guanylyltransferase